MKAAGKDTSLEEGQLLDGGWCVGRRLDRGSTPLHSTTYEVANTDGRRGFLKVIEYEWYLLSDDPAEVLRAVTQAFLDERRLLITARDNGLDRVIKMFASGVVRRSGAMPIQYLICEIADGDARQQIDHAARLSDVWALRVLHAVATGLAQLHRVAIAHQDLKPANVFLLPGVLCQNWRLRTSHRPQCHGRTRGIPDCRR